MGDIVCSPRDLGDPTTTGGVFASWTASAVQTGIGLGQTVLSAIDTPQLSQDPDGVFTLAGGQITVNRSGFAVVDWNLCVMRDVGPLVDEITVECWVNNTPIHYNGRFSPLGASYGAVSGAIPAAPGFNGFDVGVASWLNAGDVVSLRASILGAAGATCRTVAFDDLAIGNGPQGYATALYLGAGVEPHQGSVWP